MTDQIENVARAIDPVAWKWIDATRLTNPEHMALPLTVGRLIDQARASIKTANQWLPIETMPEKTRLVQNLLCHNEKRWLRFGRYFPSQREWYYSGTNERSQWAQTRGDEPTHWMPLPAFPAEDGGGA